MADEEHVVQYGRNDQSDGDEYSLLRGAIRRYRRHGLRSVLREGVNFIARKVQKAIIHPILAEYYESIRGGTFEFDGSSYSYFYHPYNRTWDNIRTVEIPVIRDILNNSDADRVLEVGDVLSNYFDTDHLILDKYTNRADVLNQDVVDFVPEEPFDLIVCISTIEHVGWDEPSSDPEKAIRALQKLRDMVATGGQLVVTFPLDYNPALDEALWNDELDATEVHYLKKVSESNRWREVERAEVRDVGYHEPYQGENSAVIAIWER